MLDIMRFKVKFDFNLFICHKIYSHRACDISLSGKKPKKPQKHQQQKTTTTRKTIAEEDLYGKCSSAGYAYSF